MPRIPITWRSQNFALDRYAAGVLPELQAAAERIASACGPGYKATSAEQGRWGGGRVVVLTSDYTSMRAEATDHNLARFGGR